MKRVILTTIMLIAVISVKSQSYHKYSYDANGNRVQRIYISTRPTYDTLAPINTEEKTAIVENTTLTNEEIFTASVSEQKITVYPNPTKGALQIDITNIAPETKGYILVTDMQGKVIHRENTLSANKNLNLTNIAKGEYVLKIVIDYSSRQWINIKE